MLSPQSPRTRRAVLTIGKAIKAAREQAGVSQAALAAKIGMSRTNFARVEHGKTNVTIDTLVRIAAGLGLDLRVEFAPKTSK